MTRKDYELVAKALNNATHATRDDERCEAVVWTAEWVAKTLKEDNKAFDKELFIKNVKGL